MFVSQLPAVLPPSTPWGAATSTKTFAPPRLPRRPFSQKKKKSVFELYYSVQLLHCHGSPTDLAYNIDCKAGEGPYVST